MFYGQSVRGYLAYLYFYTRIIADKADF